MRCELYKLTWKRFEWKRSFPVASLTSGLRSLRVTNSPVAADRKSGIPEAVEMPAPTTKATRLLFTSWLARARSWSLSDAATVCMAADASTILLMISLLSNRLEPKEALCELSDLGGC